MKQFIFVETVQNTKHLINVEQVTQVVAAPLLENNPTVELWIGSAVLHLKGTLEEVEKILNM